MADKVKDIDAYIANQSIEVRPALELLRKTIKETVPDAEEVISYNMPAFRYHGMLAGFAAAKNHYGFYPWTGRTTEQFKEELKEYITTKGAIHFPKDQPIPVELVKKIVLKRMEENLNNKK